MNDQSALTPFIKHEATAGLALVVAAAAAFVLTNVVFAEF
jgi:Na+/H+ antiporter NhaA